MADEIVQMASESGFKNQAVNLDKRLDSPEYSDSRDNHEQSYEMTTQPYNKPVYQKQQQNPPQSRLRPRMELKTASEPSISLDEIVEKVKQRLEEELLQKHYQQQNQQLQNQQLQIQQLQSQPKQLRQAVPKRNVQLTAANNAPVPQALVYDNTVAPNVAIAAPVYEEASYEETPVKPKAPVQYQGQIIQNQGQGVQNKRIVLNPNNNRNKNILKQGRYVIAQAQYTEPEPAVDLKTVRYVQQVAVPERQKVVAQQLPKAQDLVQQKRYQLQKQTVRPKIIANKKIVREPIKPVPPIAQNQEMAVEVSKENVGGIFEAVDMLKSNDSYEDYVTPPKEEVFVSDEAAETVTFVPVVVAMKNKPTNRAPTIPTVVVDEAPMVEVDANGAENADVEYEDETTGTPAEIKARTESLSYEEKETKADPNATTTTEITVKGKKITKKSKVGTMIPTREFYKISSPNYYGKLPTVAEKYNFNEPIPEQDREPENLKPIGNPPASINGKVKLS